MKKSLMRVFEVTLEAVSRGGFLLVAHREQDLELLPLLEHDRTMVG